VAQLEAGVGDAMPMQSQSGIGDDVSCIVLRGNASLSRRATLCLFAMVAAVIGALALVAFLNGAWPVGLFVAATLLALGAGFFAVCRRAGNRELLIIDAARVQVIEKRAGRELRHEFQRYWLRAELRPVRDGWYPSRLLLRSHGRELEIGSALAEDERQALFRRLQEQLRSVAAAAAPTP
jgi:uncharacterized membrane protein